MDLARAWLILLHENRWEELIQHVVNFPTGGAQVAPDCDSLVSVNAPGRTEVLGVVTEVGNYQVPGWQGIHYCSFC